jgi:multiple sugar transport system ATP-binding protein
MTRWATVAWPAEHPDVVFSVPAAEREHMAKISIEDVWKVYPDGTVAVSSVDLEIPDGALCVLVGPSGCGKTTILRMVAGLEEVTKGRISVGDREINRVAPKDRDIAMVFQNYALYPHMDVYQNMAFGLRLRRLERHEIDRRVRETASVLGLGELLKKKPRQLSGGQRQRVAMGRAIVREPQLFLMDEPLSNLDAKLRVQMREEISRIQREIGVTTIYVTHDQVEAMTMGDLVAVLKKGVLQQVDGPQELYERPTNLFVGGFIGSPAMNFVEGTIQAHDGRFFAEFGGNRLSIEDTVLAERPALGASAGRRVVVGIRPEDMEDPSFVSDAASERRIHATVDRREPMGAEVYVHFTVNAPLVLTEDTRELAADTGDEVLHRLEEQAARGTNRFIARMHPRTSVRVGDDMDIVVDTSRMHFFDPDTGAAIYGDRSTSTDPQLTHS